MTKTRWQFPCSFIIKDFFSLFYQWRIAEGKRRTTELGQGEIIKKKKKSLYIITVPFLCIWLSFYLLSFNLSIYPRAKPSPTCILSISIIRNSQTYFPSPFSSPKFHGNDSSTREWNGNQRLALCSSVIRPIRSLPQIHLSALKSFILV